MFPTVLFTLAKVKVVEQIEGLGDEFQGAFLPDLDAFGTMEG